MRAVKVGSLFGMEIYIHPAFPILILSGLVFGQWAIMRVMLVVLAAHEIGHALAAKAVGLRVPSLELTPVGGVAKIEGLYETEPWRDIVVSVAGPLTNLLIAMGAAFGAHPLGWWPGQHVQTLIRCNIALMLMNLIPVLPLDGGRILRGVLCKWMPRSRATRILAYAGMALGGLVMAAGIILLVKGHANLTLIMTGSYLIYAAASERHEAVEQVVRTLSKRSGQMLTEGLLPTKWMTLSKDYPVSKIPAKLSPKHHHMFTIVDPNGLLPLGTITERDLLNAMATNPAQSVGDVLNITVKPPARKLAARAI